MGVHFKLAPSHRAAIEDQVEALIALLDGFDGDPDLEPNTTAAARPTTGAGVWRPTKPGSRFVRS